MIYSVQQAVEKQLRDHELPTTIEGWLIVTEHFSYLVDDLHWDQGDGKQPSILLQGPEIYQALDQCEELDECFSGVALYQEEITITGLLRESGIGAFERQLYRIDQLDVHFEGDEIRIELLA